jgi:hypothetical protein
MAGTTEFARRAPQPARHLACGSENLNQGFVLCADVSIGGVLARGRSLPALEALLMDQTRIQMD